MEKISVGIVGLGFIGKQHIEAIRRIPGVKIIAASDPSPLSQKFCVEQDIQRFYQNYEEMIQDEPLDVIHDCTPNNFHYEVNKKALLNGINVFSEKPFTLQSSQAKELLEIVKNKNLIGGVNFNYRNNVMVQEMKGRIRAGLLEDITFIQGEYLQDWLLYDSDFDWRIQKEVGGISRAVADIGSHCFDAIQYITGEKIVAVYATFHQQYKTRKRYQNSETFSKSDIGGEYESVLVDNEDGANVIFQLESGLKGSINVTQLCAGKKNGLKVLIGGTGQALEWNQEDPDKLWVGNRDKGNEMIYGGSEYLTDFAKPYTKLPNGHPQGWTDALTNGFRDYYESIRNPQREYRFADFSDGYYISKIIEACVESNRQECWMHIKKEEK